MKRPLIHILIVSVVLAVFTAACGTTEATPTPVPLLERPVVTAMATDPTLKPTSAPTATALAGQATAEAPAPEPTAEPTVPVTSRPHSPRLLEHSPQEGEELAPGEPVVFTFDQPMNAASVEQALTISPELGGTLQWLDASTLQFLPGEGALLAGTRYTFALDATARAENDLALERDVTFTVRALGMLEVTGAFPVTEGAPASADAEIIVTFNRPVVPLSSLEGQGSLPNPIEIEPAVAGEGVWTNTSVFTFTPAEPLASGTTYNVTIPATLRAVRGETLAEDYRWSFSVRPPSVQLVEPELGVGSVDPETAIVLSFDQPMDRDTVSERFELLQLGDEEPVDGTLVWEGSVLRFLPRDPLPRGSSFQIRLPAGSQVANGDATMAEDQSWEMSIPALPQVTGSTPANGDSGVDLGASLYIGFSAPMDTEATIQALKITPETSTFMTWGNDDHALTISWYPQPATRYTVEISTAARDRYGVPLDKRFRLSFTTGDAPPALALLTEGSIGMYPSMSELSLGLQVMNVPAVDMDLYQLTVEDLIVLASEGGWPQWDRYNPPASGRIASWTVETKAPTNKRTVLYAPLPPGEDDTLESGTYLLVVRAPAADQPLMHLFVVSPLNVTLKTSTEEALVWVTDLASGKPVNKAAVTLYDNSGSVFAEGTTDRQGLLSLPMPKQERWEGVTVLAETEDGQGVVISNWMQGISPWDLKVNADWELHDYRTHIYTDKLLYQPGQQVLFKGFVRLDDDGNYSLPEPDTVAEVSLLESTGQTVWSERFPLSELGSLDGRVTLSESAPLGQYALVIKIGTEIQQQWFHVAEYRVPEFAVSVQTDQPEYVAGDVVELGAEATYFSGGPVSNAEVHWRVIAGGYSFDRWQQQPTFEFGERLLYGDSGAAIEDFGVLTEGAGQTGADGRFTISFPAELTGTQSRHLTFEVMVMDLSNQTITGRAQAVLHAGDGYIGINTDRYVGSEGDPLEIGLQSVSVAGEPTGNVPVQVSILQQEWLTVRREVSPGSFAWENEVRETSVHETEVTTDADGYATVNWTPETGGTFKILAEARDAKGNAIRSALYVWVSSDGYVNWGRGNNLHMDLVSDKKLYEVGDTASILVPSPFEGPVSALLTIERGGLLEHRVLTLTGNSEVIPIEIEEAFAPNVYVSVVLISGADSNEGEPGARVGTVILPVSTAERELTVSVTPDTEGPVKPGDKVTFAISVSDASGKPVAAEVSAQLVDLALETLAGGSSLSVLDTFYRERGLGVVTAMSLVRRHVPLEDTT
ncbi:MAG: hypothetical protein GXY79_01210, partial [Chloroflexi bacterium]|nr:hypothetical protein [Chloroflexota bacterium]